MIERKFPLFSPSDSLCDLCAMFCVAVRSRVSPTIFMYSRFSLTNLLCSAFKEAKREDVPSVDF